MNLAFLRPEALWAAPAAALPVLLHFWGRTRAPRYAFSAVDLLREAARRRFHPEKLRRLALLLVRTLLLLACLAWAARPVLRGAAGGGGVLLLDASYSMGASIAGRTAFERARELASEILGRSDGERWGLVVFSDRVESALPLSEPGRARAALEKASLSFRGTRVGPALEAARGLLPSGGVVLLLSDAAAHGWKDVSLGPGPQSILLVDVGVERPNAAVLGMGAGEPGRVDLSLARWGSGPEASRGWGVLVDGRLASRGSASWEGRGARVGVPAPAAPAAEFRLDADDLADDDRWFFVPEPAGGRSLLIVNGAPGLSPISSETRYVSPVLNDLARRGWRMGEASPAELEEEGWGEWDAVALFNVPRLGEAAMGRLRRFLDGGGGLWVTAGDRAGSGGLESLLPLSGLERRRLEEATELPPGPPPLAAEGLELFEWDRVHVALAETGAARDGARVVLRSRSSRSPLVALGAWGGGRVAYWAFSVDRDWTNFPAKPGYPVLVQAVLDHVGGARATASGARVGETLTLVSNAPGGVVVRRPDGREDPAVRSGAGWTYGNADRPGFYRFEREGRALQTTAVNLDAREGESDLARVTAEEVARRLPGTETRLLSLDQSGAGPLDRLVHGRDMAPAAARAVFLFFLMETLLLLPGRRPS